jgi:hypothetical protein
MSTYEEKLAAAKEYLGVRYQGHPNYVKDPVHPCISHAADQARWAVQRTYKEFV